MRSVVEEIDNVAFFVFFGFLLVWVEIVGLKQSVYQQIFFLDYFVLGFLLVVTAFFLWAFYKKNF